MANNQFAVTLYGRVSTTDNKNGGILLVGNGFSVPRYESLPVVGTKVTGVSPAVVMTTAFGSVTVNSIIEVYPAGLTLPAKPDQFICDATVATLATART